MKKTTTPKRRAHRKLQPRSYEFRADRSTAKYYLLAHIPAPLWTAARAKATREGVSMRALLLGFLTTYTTTPAPTTPTDERTER